MIRSLAWRSVKARKGRAVLNGLGIVLGVALFFSVLSLSKTIVSTFDELFSAVYGKTDLIVAGSDSAGTVEEGLLSKVQKVDGVSETSAVVAGLISLKKDGEKPGQSDQVFVGTGTAETAAGKVGTFHRITVVAVAAQAVGLVQAPAVLDVAGCVTVFLGAGTAGTA